MAFLTQEGFEDQLIYTLIVGHQDPDPGMVACQRVGREFLATIHGLRRW
jgi:hypothetical protein